MILLQCPYCKVTLPKDPTRKTKCVNCGNYYYKRNHPQDRYVYEIVTEEQAKKIDALWFKVNTAHTVISGERKDIKQVYTKLEKFQELLKMALTFGSISVGNDTYNLYELEHMENAIIQELVIESQKRLDYWESSH